MSTETDGYEDKILPTKSLPFCRVHTILGSRVGNLNGLVLSFPISTEQELEIKIIPNYKK